MISSIYFDNQHLVKADKVGNEIGNDMLASELYP